jgi:hypothetical protein
MPPQFHLGFSQRGMRHCPIRELASLSKIEHTVVVVQTKKKRIPEKGDRRHDNDE